MKEAVEIVKKLWTEEKTSYEGKHFRISEAVCKPKPLQKPHPPITIGGSGEKHTLKVTAQLADRCDLGYQPSLQQYKRKLRIIKNHCKTAGRNFQEIEKSAWPAGQIILATNRRELDAKIQRLKPQGTTRAEFEKHSLVGTPEECVAKLQPYVDLGVTHFMLFFGDLPDTSGLRLLAEAAIR